MRTLKSIVVALQIVVLSSCIAHQKENDDKLMMATDTIITAPEVIYVTTADSIHINEESGADTIVLMTSDVGVPHSLQPKDSLMAMPAEQPKNDLNN